MRNSRPIGCFLLIYFGVVLLVLLVVLLVTGVKQRLTWGWSLTIMRKQAGAELCQAQLELASG